MPTRRTTLPPGIHPNGRARAQPRLPPSRGTDHRGPAWLDTLLLLVNVRLHGGDPDLATVDADHTDLAGARAFFADAARQPAAPGLPSLPAFPQAQADAVVSWPRVLAG